MTNNPSATTRTPRRCLVSAENPISARKRSRRRFRRAGLAGLLAIATVTATGGSLALPQAAAHAAGCNVKGGVWAPVNIRQSPNTTSSVIASIGSGQAYQSQCSVITGGGYTACSSSGTFEDRWVPIIQSGYTAWRCVIGPYAV